MDILSEQHVQNGLQPGVQVCGATMDGIMDPALQRQLNQLLSGVYTRSDALSLSDLWQQQLAALSRADSVAAQKPQSRCDILPHVPV